MKRQKICIKFNETKKSCKPGTMWFNRSTRTLRMLTEIKDGKECWRLIESNVPLEMLLSIERFCAQGKD